MNYDLVTEVLLKQHDRRSEPNPPYSDYLAIINARNQVLERFQPEFSRPEELTKLTFRDFLTFEHNRHWTGLQRPSSHACDDMPKLRRAVAFLFDEDVGIIERLDELTSGQGLSVRGISIGILTPMLLIRYPEKYGVWNGKSEAALKKMNAWPRLARGTSKGARYVVLNDIYVELSRRSHIDLWCLDALWHVINEKSKLETDDAFRAVELEEKAYFEGRRLPTSGYRIERNAEARDACIEAKGLHCAICNFNFFESYGDLGMGYIHVHHKDDLAQSEGIREVDPKKHLTPVCPNCHAMLHKGVKKARSVDKLKKIMQRVAGRQKDDAKKK